MANTAADILAKIKDEQIEWVDLRFTDPKGKWQHLTMVAGLIGEDELTDGLMFDGSSIAGWNAINESDMILMPDLDAVYTDPISATPMLLVFCDVVEPATGQGYSREIGRASCWARGCQPVLSSAAAGALNNNTSKNRTS